MHYIPMTPKYALWLGLIEKYPGDDMWTLLNNGFLEKYD